jgi:dihydrofolate reductase
MRKLIASTFLSLDGFVSAKNEDMGWVINGFNDQMGKYAGDLMESMDAILLGRVTYEIMAKVWPFQTEATSPGADKMNGTPKIVFSRTLRKGDWGTYGNVTFLRDNVADEVAKLKRQPGRNMVIYGSANLVQGFTRLGLIDEYQVLVHPVLLGAGKPLFAGIPQQVNLKLTRSETFTNGVVVLYYQPR